MRIALIETAFVAMVFNKGFEQGTYEVEVLARVYQPGP